MRGRVADFWFQVFALLIAVIVVHAAYVGVIRPKANAVLEQQLARQAAGEPYVAQRSAWVVIRDYEQEACFILMFWALAMMGAKARRAMHERGMLRGDLVDVREGTSILPEDAREYSRPIQSLPGWQLDLLVPRALLAALQRFGSTRNIASASMAIKEVCDTHSDRLDSELAMIRYIAWAIPSIGFIGTVRGIGEALGEAHRAMQGDIAGVAVSLGVAFNSTFIALVISIVIMFFSHQLQLLQERLVLDTQTYCDERLMRYLKVR